MNKWKSSKLGEIARIKSGKNYSKIKCDYNNDKLHIAYYRVSDLSKRGLKSPKYSAKLENVNSNDIIKENTLLISTTGTIGNVGITSESSIINNNMKAIIVNEEVILTEFVMNYMIFINNELINRSKRTTLATIDMKTLSEIEIFYPESIEYQLTINKNFNMLYKSKSEKNIIIKEIEKLICNYIDKFVDRSKKSEFSVLSDFCSSKPKLGLTLRSSNYSDNGIPLASLSNTGIFDLKNIRTKTVNAYTHRLSEYYLEKNNILITRQSSVENLGNNILIRSIYQPVVYDSHSFKVELDEKKLSPEVLFLWLKSSVVDEFLNEKSLTSGWNAIIKLKDLMNIPIYKQIVDNQDKLIKLFLIYEKLIEDLKSSMELIELLISDFSNKTFNRSYDDSNIEIVNNYNDVLNKSKVLYDEKLRLIKHEGNIFKPYFNMKELPIVIDKNILNSIKLSDLPYNQRFKIENGQVNDKTYGNMRIECFYITNKNESVIFESIIPVSTDDEIDNSDDILEMQLEDFVYKSLTIDEIDFTNDINIVSNLISNIEIDNECYSRFQSLTLSQKKFLGLLSNDQKMFYEVYLKSPKPLAIHEAYKFFLNWNKLKKNNYSLHDFINTTNLLYRFGLIEKENELKLAYPKSENESTRLIEILRATHSVERWKCIT